MVLMMALTVPAASFADNDGSSSGPGNGRALVPKRLLDAAKSREGDSFQVIIQGRGKSSGSVGDAVKLSGGHLKREFRSIVGVSATVNGRALEALSRNPHVQAITPDTPMRSADLVSTTTYAPPPQNAEMWRQSTRVDQLWDARDPYTGAVTGPAPQAPAIAIVDSGIDASRSDVFGNRVVARVNLSSLSPLASGDDQGHGTMVAGLAAGASEKYPGVAKNAPIVDVRVSDANGQSIVSDVVAAADWILANKDAYNIRVANFSLRGSVETSFRFDPLDKAVEKLWFNGIVVVAAGGNHGTTTGAVSMSYAPGNDPFIISVAAADENQTADPLDNSTAWWSGFGYTMDGFHKPDMAAPGRYLIMPAPETSTIAKAFPERLVEPGYMWMSGTSFAAPVVAGAAAQLLARHPDWGPDEVKGALMLASNYLGGPGIAAGTGQIDASYAASFDFLPPNPNENLYAFVAPDATGQRAFNEASWSEAVKADASWSSASWSSASWSSASWSSTNFASASWSSASWSSDVSSTMAAELSANETAASESTFNEALSRP